MRILIVTTFFPPMNSTASLRPYSWAKCWTILGYDITVLTVQREYNPMTALNLPNPGFELIEIPPPPFVDRLKNFENSPSKYKRLLANKFNNVRKKTGIFNSCRMPDSTHFWIKPALEAIKEKEKWDMVISTSGPYTTHILAEKIKRKGLAKKWIADFRAPWTANANYPGLFPFTTIERIWERKLMRAADAITTISMPLSIKLAAQHGNEKIHIIENGCDPIDPDSLDPTPIFPNDGKYRIIHTGPLYFDQKNLVPLFSAIREISEDSTHKYLLEKLEVLFVGVHQENIQNMINAHRIGKWVHMQGFTKREKSLRMQRDGHALLFFPCSNLTENDTLLNKIFEYLCSGTPIIAIGGDNLETSQQLILDAKAGEIFTNSQQIKHFLLTQLKEVKKQRTGLNPALLHRYDRRTLAMKFLDLAHTTTRS